MNRCMLGGLVATAIAMIGCGAAESGDDADLASLGEEHARELTQSLKRKPVVASYVFPTPEGWVTETDPLPPPWDPTFPFTGIEELRFPPGWPDPATGDWWSYDYLLWIDSGPAVSASVLESALVSYYKGLMDSCISVPCDPSKFAAHLRKVASTPALSVFAGHTDIFDSFGTPITLNLVVSSVVCPRSKHRAVLFSASPFPATAPIWRDLLGLQLQFRCN